MNARRHALHTSTALGTNRALAWCLARAELLGEQARAAAALDHNPAPAGSRADQTKGKDRP